MKLDRGGGRINLKIQAWKTLANWPIADNKNYGGEQVCDSVTNFVPALHANGCGM